MKERMKRIFVSMMVESAKQMKIDSMCISNVNLSKTMTLGKQVNLSETQHPKRGKC